MPQQSEFRSMLVDVIEQMSNRVSGKTGDVTSLPSWQGIPDAPYEPAGPVLDGDGNPMAATASGESGWTPSSTGSLAWGGHQNGHIPKSQMVSVARGHRLEASAAEAWQQMVAAAKRDGVDLSLTDSYRDFDGQVAVRKEKGHLVATAKPGTSNHGWGRAVDINVKQGAALAWLRSHADTYGWVNPAWAQRSGKSYEPWHWEFQPGTPTQQAPAAAPKVTAPAPPAPAAGPTASQTGRDADGRNFEE